MAEENREAPLPRGSVVRTTSVVLVLAAVAGTAVLFVREHRANARQVEQLQRDLDRGPVVRVARVKLAPAEHMVSLPAEVRADLERTLAEEIARRRVVYRRSDGSEWTLTLADVLARTEALEGAYNPNDCVEIRWGAPSGSAESATCRRRAPRDQDVLMEEYREWFRERRRPPRA